MDVWRAQREDLGLKWAMEACRLWEVSFSKGEEEPPLVERAVAFLARERVSRGMVEGSEVFHLVTGSGKLDAVAWSFIREVAIEGFGEPVPILALAGVCSSLEARGRGFGAAVVRDAFSRVGPEVEWSLFQTGVPRFYQKLGAELVTNRFVNSLSEKDVEANPWWDEHVMVYRSGRKWPDGRVDMLGEAY